MHIEINRGNTYKNSGAVISKAKSRMIKKSYMSIEKYATQGVQADYSAKKAITIANSTANLNSEQSGHKQYQPSDNSSRQALVLNHQGVGLTSFEVPGTAIPALMNKSNEAYQPAALSNKLSDHGSPGGGRHTELQLVPRGISHYAGNNKMTTGTVSDPQLKQQRRNGNKSRAQTATVHTRMLAYGKK